MEFQHEQAWSRLICTWWQRYVYISMNPADDVQEEYAVGEMFLGLLPRPGSVWLSIRLARGKLVVRYPSAANKRGTATLISAEHITVRDRLAGSESG